VRLVAVSKTFASGAVREAARAGMRDFGENYVTEGVDKIRELRPLGLTWHYIGPIQSNKTRLIAKHFDWVHSVEREKIAARLSEARGAEQTELQVCIQVNVSGEETKSGVAPGALAPLAREVARLPRLKLRGLMAIPEPTPDERMQRKRFAQLRALLDELNRSGLALDTLSMGMSADLEAAIAEGATMLRVGTAIFGERTS
jgi:PLP dependent protein